MRSFLPTDAYDFAQTVGRAREIRDNEACFAALANISKTRKVNDGREQPKGANGARTHRV